MRRARPLVDDAMVLPCHGIFICTFSIFILISMCLLVCTRVWVIVYMRVCWRCCCSLSLLIGFQRKINATLTSCSGAGATSNFDVYGLRRLHDSYWSSRPFPYVPMRSAIGTEWRAAVSTILLIWIYLFIFIGCLPCAVVMAQNKFEEQETRKERTHKMKVKRWKLRAVSGLHSLWFNACCADYAL